MTIISTSHKFVFVHIHKNGGTSVETILEPYMMWNDLVLGSTELGALLNPFYSSRYGLTKHSKLARIEEVCKDYVDWKNFHCFALVRHPKNRLKIEGHHTHLFLTDQVLTANFLPCHELPV